MFDPRFTITTRILKDVATIEAAKEIISTARLIPAWERQFRQEAIVRQVHHSTHIEGNPLSLVQAQQIVDGLVENIEGKDRDIQEIINYRNVIKYINEYRIPRIDKSIYLLIHKLIVANLLPENQAGKLRQVDVSIISNLSQQVVFKPPPWQFVDSQVDQFFHWLYQPQTVELPAAIKAGIGHYELVRIHPFVDGNGRSARVMAMLLLYQEGYDMKQFFCLDEYYDNDPANYYAALQSANDTGDLTGWLEYFIHGLAVEFARIKDRVLELSRDHALRSKLGQISLNDRQAKILRFLEEYDRISNADWQKLIPSVSDDTILRDIKDLIKKKLIKKRGKTKAAYYELK